MERVEVDCHTTEAKVIPMDAAEEMAWEQDRQQRQAADTVIERATRARELVYAETQLAEAVSLRNAGTFKDSDLAPFQKARDDAFSDMWAIKQVER